MNLSPALGHELYELASTLFPICRSLTGNGVRDTFEILKKHLPCLTTFEVPSGTKCFDWEIPNEWNIKDAYLVSPSGDKIADFKKNNLSVVGYSVPTNKFLSLEELSPHLHSLPGQPDAVPYVTSYYKENWGFCLPHNLRATLTEGKYHAYIDSVLSPGHLTYGEVFIQGSSTEEIFLSTYICHPSMANNELSGPVVTTFLIKWLLSLKERHYSYRIIFVPETIGAILYLSKHLEHLKKHVVAGFNISCVGDNRCYSYIPSRKGGTLADRAALHVLKYIDPNFKHYTFLNRGSDERQYCSPHIDLPIAVIARSKYGEYPEYHTSDDNLDFISPEGLYGGFIALQKALLALEMNEILDTLILAEPKLDKRGLYPSLSVKGSSASTRPIKNLIAYSDGTMDLIGIAEIIGVSIFDLLEPVKMLKESQILKGSRR